MKPVSYLVYFGGGWMEKKNGFTRFLAITGTALLWLVLLAPVAFSIVRYSESGMLRFDFLLPGELFFLVLAAALMLLWSAWRAHKLRAPIGWTLAAALVLLFGSQGIAVLTGLASGEHGPSGWPFIVVMGMLIAYDLAVLALAVEGILLVRELYRTPPVSPESAPA